jgi:uncharacterized protein YrrD
VNERAQAGELKSERTMDRDHNGRGHAPSRTGWENRTIMIDIPLKARVRCTDGVAGTSEAVIYDPTEQRVTHLVLRQRGALHTKRLVPIDLVRTSTEDEIELGCSLSDVRDLENFSETRLVPAPPLDLYGGIPIVSGSAWPSPVAYPREKVPVTSERIPIGELAMNRDAEVYATDGPVGRVDAFLLGRRDGQVTHVVVRSGHVARREFTVPVSEIARIDDDRILLRLDHKAVRELPDVPYHSLSLLPGVDEIDGRLVPESPRAGGLPDVGSDPSHIEGAHLLAEEAELRLAPRGFTRDQILDWAKEYLVSDGSGAVDGLIAWIDEKEHGAR